MLLPFCVEESAQPSPIDLGLHKIKKVKYPFASYKRAKMMTFWMQAAPNKSPGGFVSPVKTVVLILKAKRP